MTQLNNMAIEAVARMIYETWSNEPGYVAWVAGGNSNKQDDARKIAIVAVETYLSALPPGDNAGLIEWLRCQDHEFCHEAADALSAAEERAEIGACDGCGSTETIEQIRAAHPTALSCCPERKMLTAAQWRARAVEAERELAERAAPCHIGGCKYADLQRQLAEARDALRTIVHVSETSDDSFGIQRNAMLAYARAALSDAPAPSSAEPAP